ncbi:ABC transporter permease [Actinoplanes sp. RD1]|uniref:ABC transporter permease n=1 Tax=Actinoplanes sp. RD1 TaxID=3064538 RepID=UPI002740EE7E|nr:ABC transporter permease subunit [Actinoplanes sp. RD1]
MSRAGRWARGLAGLAAVVALSQVLAATGAIRADFLPPAGTVLARAADLTGDREFLLGVAHTVRAWLTGLACAVGLGIGAGLLLGSVPALDDAVRPVLEFLRPVPSVALIPLAGLLLGAGLRSEVTLVTYAALWPVLFATVYGLRHADPVPRETLRVFGFGRLAIVWRVALPAAVPFIATGVRLAAAVGLILAVGTEILAGFGTGLGVFIAQAQQVVDGTTDVLAGTVWAGTLGLIANAVLASGERRLLPWRAAA